ncbi:sugar phosphate nucleotidyltransferase [Paenibacillus agilis]|uniref:Glucose-1-phosphate thymidylyltransferase n=1 Tax=Paenibacillus agilis TaxID=3020863 RepID=A0A559IHN3_9BACL|nr:sugar phosphate nucleotidyltransferase [Paenibacillus agilis]TVX87176.1 spore coat protein [Paenibacillus agilis]
MKGIILAGGTGSRLLPLTKMMNKHLIPIGKFPMIYYGIERLKEAGITELFIVIGSKSVPLYVDFIGSGQSLGVHVSFLIQEGAGGIAQALSLVEPFLAPNERFVVLLGDNLFHDSLKPYLQQFENQGDGEALVLLKKVKDAHRYGVPVLDEQEPERIIKIEEKPRKPKSSFCVTGIYMYDTAVFEHIRHISPSARGELEITDVNNAYASKGLLQYNILNGWWTDAGTYESLHAARIKLGRRGKR